MGWRGDGLWCMVDGSVLRLQQGFRFRVLCFFAGVEGLRVTGSWFGVLGLGFRV